MTDDKRQCASRILRMRIGFALRRATGMVIDVDAMLSRPHLLARRLATWRAVGSAELNALIDELEREMGEALHPRESMPPLRADVRAGAHRLHP